MDDENPKQRKRVRVKGGEGQYSVCVVALHFKALDQGNKRKKKNTKKDKIIKTN